MVSNKLLKKINREYMKLNEKYCYEECFHKDEDCSENIIKAHSIQNSKILESISDEKNKVVIPQICNSKNDIMNLSLKFQRRKDATIFKGFCSNHDKHIFKPIEEKDYELGNNEQEFLYAYRAIAKEYSSKTNVKNICEDVLYNEDNKIKSLINDYYIQQGYLNCTCFIDCTQNILENTNMTLKTMKYYKTAMHYNLNNKKFNKLRTNAIVYNKRFDVAVSSIFYLEEDLEGNIINNLRNAKSQLYPIIVTVFPQNNKTYILLSYFNKDKEKYRVFIEQLFSKSIEQQKIIISNLILSHCENLVLSPNLLDRLNQDKNINYTKNAIMNLYSYKNIDNELNLFI